MESFVKPQDLRPEGVPNMMTGAEAIRVTFPARRSHARIFRTLCEGLAEQARFNAREVFLIKLAADEVFTNAVEHGSDSCGAFRISGDIVVDDEGITVMVRDEGGRPFNYQRYQAGLGERSAGAVRSGLDIVNKMMDSWGVRTEQGKFTEVTFRKKRAQA